MLIKMTVLERIQSGDITHVYRRWKKPAAKVGGRQRTPLGEFAITSVEALGFDELDATDVTRGGYASLDALRAELSTREGQVFRIGMRFDRADPRLALREDTSAASIAEVCAKLARKDARSEPWTRAYLDAIQRYPERRAQDIADELGLDKPTFKRRVRQLKELGLTISFSPGYRLSPRGEAVLAALKGES